MEPLVGAGAAVDEVIVGVHGAGQHLEDGELTDERSAIVLKTCSRGAASAEAGDVDSRVACCDGHGTVGRTGAELADQVGESVEADAGRGRAQQDGELDAVEHLVGECALELCHRGHVARQIALELVVVAGHDLLDEGVVERMLLGCHIVRHRLHVVGAAWFVLVGLLGQDIGDAMQGRLLTDRQLQRSDAGAERRLELVEHAVEVGALLVLLVHEEHARHAAGCGDAPQDLGLHLDAVDGADDEHREVAHGQRCLDLTDEVGVPSVSSRLTL